MTEHVLRYGVAGSPIAHSLSPLIHNSWLRACGAPFRYGAFDIPEGEFSQGLDALQSKGVVGLNVTLPHKVAALNSAATASAAARRIGAANVLSASPSGWRAENTDAQGFLDDFRPKVDSVGRVLVIGAGGAARAVVYALVEQGFDVSVVNRTAAKADALLADIGASRRPGDVLVLDQLRDGLETADMVVNATSIGHGQDGFDWPDGRGRLLYDLSYGKAAARVISDAAQRGWRTSDGLGMLVAQAALSFEIWFGETPNRGEAEQLCRTALEAAE